MNKLPKKNIRILRIQKLDLLEILCYHYLGDDLEGYTDWYAQFIQSDGNIEFAAVYGFDGDNMYEEMKNAIRQKAQQITEDSTGCNTIMNKLPKKNIRILRVQELDLLEILCDYFLGDNLEGYSDWYAQFIQSDGNIEFAAVYGFDGDEMYGVMKNAIRQKAQQITEDSTGATATS